MLRLATETDGNDERGLQISKELFTIHGRVHNSFREVVLAWDNAAALSLTTSVCRFYIVPFPIAKSPC